MPVPLPLRGTDGVPAMILSSSTRLSRIVPLWLATVFTGTLQVVPLPLIVPMLAPLCPPVVVRVKSVTSTPVTGMLKVTVNVVTAAWVWLVAPARVILRTAGIGIPDTQLEVDPYSAILVSVPFVAVPARSSRVVSALLPPLAVP